MRVRGRGREGSEIRFPANRRCGAGESEGDLTGVDCFYAAACVVVVVVGAAVGGVVWLCVWVWWWVVVGVVVGLG